MPAHCRMRAYDRDLIRGGHYGQRPRVPHKQAEHMAHLDGVIGRTIFVDS